MVEISADEIFENIVNEYLRKFLEKNPISPQTLGFTSPTATCFQRVQQEGL
jgi:hypothetical protein